ncbi:MAG: HDOD domain-containing protein [Deltaproteobacteria bacterium]|nr:HDOD domain-containing protein [Deltaproteobacteria bacterium]
MGLFSKIKRHSAIATGHFASMFKNVEIPPLPTAVTRLINEMNQEEPDIERLVRLISSETGLASKLIKTANSPLFRLVKPASSVRHVVTLLGFRQVQSVALAYATMEAVPVPKGELFDHEAFWIDSLIRALFARSFATKLQLGKVDDVFTATLLDDISLPILLTAWKEYYEPVVEQWGESPARLSEIEREHFGWDHAQASAWITQSWGLPEDMVCFMGAHNLPWEKIEEFELTSTVATAPWIAAILPSILKPDAGRVTRMISAAENRLQLGHDRFVQSLREVEEAFGEILSLFQLPSQKADPLFKELNRALEENEPEQHE